MITINPAWLEPNAVVPVDADTTQQLVAAIGALQQRIGVLQEQMSQEQQGALLYIAAIVERAVGVGVNMTFSDEDMQRAMDLDLERADPPDGGLVLRVLRKAEPPQPPRLVVDNAPVLAKAEKTIVLLDPSGQPNQ